VKRPERRPGLGAGSVDPVFSTISCAVRRAELHEPGADWQTGGQRPDWYTFVICCSGAARFVVDGQPHELAPGSVLLLPPRVPCAARRVPRDTGEPLSFYTVDFTAWLHGILDVAAFCRLPTALRPSAARWSKFIVSARTMVLHLAKRMPGYELAVHTHCVRLLDLLWKETLEQGASERTPARSRTFEATRLMPALREIEARAAGHVTLAQLAAAVHLHPAYFCTLFKRHAGVTPMQYVTEYRLQRARDLLLLTDRSVAEIASLTGFCDAPHLIRTFRRVEGISPGRYRRCEHYDHRANLR
jgi:AraC-like DNA-binding protein